jgi:tRNA (cytidine32/uridine32-2'-O)-methyltransferase
VSGATGTECAIVFGREHSGLTNDELGRCHHLVHIPSDPQYSSLNLAAAVQVVSYELRMASIAASRSAPAEAKIKQDASSDQDEPLAPAEDMARFYEHLEQTLVEVGFLDPENPRSMMRRLRRLFNRSRPNVTEMNILRGILTAAQKSKHSPN